MNEIIFVVEEAPEGGGCRPGRWESRSLPRPRASRNCMSAFGMRSAVISKRAKRPG